jgi:hypothetical protein
MVLYIPGACCHALVRATERMTPTKRDELFGHGYRWLPFVDQVLAWVFGLVWGLLLAAPVRHLVILTGHEKSAWPLIVLAVAIFVALRLGRFRAFIYMMAGDIRHPIVRILVEYLAVAYRSTLVLALMYLFAAFLAT